MAYGDKDGDFDGASNGVTVDDVGDGFILGDVDGLKDGVVDG